MPRDFILLRIKRRGAWIKRVYFSHMLQRMMEMPLKGIKGSIMTELK